MRDFHQACEVQEDMYRETPRQRYMTCIKAIAQAHLVAVREILGSSKRKTIAAARRDCYYELHRQFGLNPAEVGRVLNKDRSSVTCSYRKYGDPRHIRVE